MHNVQWLVVVGVVVEFRKEEAVQECESGSGGDDSGRL